MAKNEEKKPAAAEQAQPPAAEQQAKTAEADASDQQAKTAEADAATIRSLHEMIMMVGEQLEALSQRMAALEQRVAAMGEPVTAELATTALAQIEFDPAWLEGLEFADAKEAKSETGDNGRSVKRYQPFKRPVTLDDVMSWRGDDDSVTIVLADGSKHQVER